MKKGSPTKPATRRPAAEEDRTQEATVKVHVYNQSQATRHEGNRGVLRIKERLPEKWQTNQQDLGQENQPDGTDESQGCSDLDQENDSSLGCNNGSNVGEGGHATTLGVESTKVGCSECGCANVHAVPSTSSDNVTNVQDQFTSRLLPPTSQALPPSMQNNR